MQATYLTDLRLNELRPEIASAWRRAALAGLHPSADVRPLEIEDVDQGGKLATAAGSILDKMSADLIGTSFAILLSDRKARIIDRRVGRKETYSYLDRIHAVPGIRFTEETSGTNALATAYELRRPIAVTGDEHFLDSMKSFCCFGAPIIHPVTQRLEGVLDVTGPVEDASPLLRPFVMQAVREIESRLVEGEKLSGQQLLVEFQKRRRNRSHPVVVLGEDLILSNQSALDLIANSDFAALRLKAAELQESGESAMTLTLNSGEDGDASIARVAGSRDGLVIEVIRRTTPRTIASDRGGIAPPAETVARVILIAGEPGSGRTRQAKNIAGADAIILDAIDAISDDEDTWIRKTLAAIRSAEPIVLDNVHTLPARLAACLTSAIKRARGTIVVTSSTEPVLGAEHSALTAIANERHILRPVRMYKQDFVDLAHSVLRDIDPESQLMLAPSASTLLAAHVWPGNVSELRKVLVFASRGRKCGSITATDLPATHRSVAIRKLTPMETAERDAIISVLRRSQGKKAVAAAELGISRTTLYDRIRRYNIVE